MALNLTHSECAGRAAATTALWINQPKRDDWSATVSVAQVVSEDACPPVTSLHPHPKRRRRCALPAHSKFISFSVEFAIAFALTA